MNNKNGFTLVELLAVLMILAVIMVFIVPKVLKTYNENDTRLTDFQKKLLTDAVELYINDTCLNPINNTYICDFSTVKDKKGNIIISNTVISLEDFLLKGYLDSKGKLVECEGNIYINNNEVDISEINCSS